MKINADQLKVFLIDTNLITEEQFEKAREKMKKTGQNIGEILVLEGLVSQEEFIKLQAYILGIPFVNLEKEITEIKTISIEREEILPPPE